MRYESNPIELEILKKMRKKCYRMLKEGLGAKTNKVIRAMLVEVRQLIADIKNLNGDWDKIKEFTRTKPYELEQLYWATEEVVEAVEVVEVVEVVEATEEVVEETEEVQIIETIEAEIEALTIERNKAQIEYQTIKTNYTAAAYRIANEKLMIAINKMVDYNNKRCEFLTRGWGVLIPLKNILKNFYKCVDIVYTLIYNNNCKI